MTNDETATPGAEDNTRADRFKLRPDVEKHFEGYELLHKRLLQGATGLGVAGVLATQALSAIAVSSNTLVQICGGFLIAAALVLAVLTTPLFYAAYSAWIGKERTYKHPDRVNWLGGSMSIDRWSWLFAVPSVLMFIALVTVLTDRLDREVQKQALSEQVKQAEVAADRPTQD